MKFTLAIVLLGLVAAEEDGADTTDWKGTDCADETLELTDNEKTACEAANKTESGAKALLAGGMTLATLLAAM